MSKRKSRSGASRAQKVVAIILLVCMVAMGSATFLVAANSGNSPAPPATQQSR
jgi:hypothetical protein